jgi:hypothetical protein
MAAEDSGDFAADLSSFIEAGNTQPGGFYQGGSTARGGFNRFANLDDDDDEPDEKPSCKHGQHKSRVIFAHPPLSFIVHRLESAQLRGRIAIGRQRAAGAIHGRRDDQALPLVCQRFGRRQRQSDARGDCAAARAYRA